MHRDGTGLYDDAMIVDLYWAGKQIIESSLFGFASEYCTCRIQQYK